MKAILAILFFFTSLQTFACVQSPLTEEEKVEILLAVEMKIQEQFEDYTWLSQEVSKGIEGNCHALSVEGEIQVETYNSGVHCKTDYSVSYMDSDVDGFSSFSMKFDEQACLW